MSGGNLRLPSWVIPTLAAIAGVILILLCFLVADLQNQKPNTASVVATARASTFEVTCGSATGTGFAVEAPVPDGYKTAVLSAAHIFDECDEETQIQVTVGGRGYSGLLFRKDPIKSNPNGDHSLDADIALIYLTVDLPKLKAAPEARVGDWAIVLGNPWSKKNYATFGIITEVSDDEYGTDAAANPGNSGGPLLDSQGRILGVMSYLLLHSEHDFYAPNKSDVYDANDGMAFAKRLVLSCPVVYAASPACPFED